MQVYSCAADDAVHHLETGHFPDALLSMSEPSDEVYDAGERVTERTPGLL